MMRTPDTRPDPRSTPEPHFGCIPLDAQLVPSGSSIVPKYSAARRASRMTGDAHAGVTAEHEVTGHGTGAAVW
jgi:hypothetical protein